MRRLPELTMVLFGLFLIVFTACSDDSDGGAAGKNNSACLKEFRCGLHDGEEAYHACLTERETKLAALEIVSANGDDCMDIFEEYKKALKCVAGLSCEQMAVEISHGVTEWNECFEECQEKLDGLVDTDACFSGFEGDELDAIPAGEWFTCD